MRNFFWDSPWHGNRCLAAEAGGLQNGRDWQVAFGTWPAAVKKFAAVEIRPRLEWRTDAGVEKSVAFLGANQHQPFFLFFASHDIHVPRIPHERFVGKSKLGYRGDCILQLDWCVGEIIDAVDRLGMSENTLIVFCSDNGPVMDDGYKDFALEKLGSHRANGPFSGGKYSVNEGGTRTPFLTSWKGTIKPGVSDEIVCTIDLAHSLAALVKQELPADACLDSVNLLPALLGQPNAKGRDHLVQQNNTGNQFGFRMRGADGGDWKLIVSPKGQSYNLRINETLKGTPVPRIQLFDLRADPGEQTNLSEQHPEIVERLNKRLEAIKSAPGPRFE